MRQFEVVVNPSRKVIPVRRWVHKEPQPPLVGDRGLDVTVCIAGIPLGQPPSIITASDTKVSLGFASFDLGVTKVIQIARNWYAMFSGDQDPPYKAVVEHFKRAISVGPIDWMSVQLSAEDARNTFTAAYEEELKRKATETILATYGVSVDEFRTAEWRERIGEREFARKNRQIDKVNLDLYFILAGFDTLGQPHLYRIAPPGAAVEEMSAFSATGSGTWTAYAWLANTRAAHLPLVEMTYRICEAKFLSESAEGVGPATLIGICRFNEPFKFLDVPYVKRIRESWEKPQYAMPAEALTAIRDGLKTSDTVENYSKRLDEELGRQAP